MDSNVCGQGKMAVFNKDYQDFSRSIKTNFLHLLNNIQDLTKTLYYIVWQNGFRIFRLFLRLSILMKVPFASDIIVFYFL